MAKLSVLIPSRNERFLQKTIDDVFAKARGEIEVIAVLDGYWPESPIAERANLTLIHRSEARGMRAAINGAASIATGEYLLKCDAHCLFAEGFDEVLKADCADNWIVIPARYSLDAENWAILQTGKSRVDYHYLSYPYPEGSPNGAGLHGVVWKERARERLNRTEYDLDDEMSFQGSCWFMTAKHFRDHLGGMSEVGYKSFMQEPQEIGLKTWLGPWGGRVVVNKRTWYAHLHKGKQYGRGYSLPHGERERCGLWASNYWMSNSWQERAHDIDWLIDKFSPVPEWGSDWRERIEKRDARYRVEP